MKSDLDRFDQDENPYQVMELASAATEEDIRRAYFKLVRKHPPERDSDQFKRIRAAYDILRDPTRRAEWDLFIAVQPPDPLPSRRRPKPDLTFHREDVIWLLRQELRSSLRDAEADFCPIGNLTSIGGSTYIPRVQDLLGNHLGMEPRSVVNPREVVALGAAVQGAIIAGQPVEAILVDVTPHSLGIEIATIQMGQIIPGMYKVLIPRNSAVPTSQEEVFYTLFPDQDTVEIKVYQGENPLAEQNTLLGEFLVGNLKPQRSGELAEVDVQFSLDIDGVLHVEATDRRTRKKKGITVTASPTRMNASEIARARAELQLWDEEAGPLLARARLLLQEDLAEDNRKELQRAIAELENALQSDDRDALEACKDELLYVLYELEE